MTSPFQIVGPFQFDRYEVHETEYRSDWWDDIDNDNMHISYAKGIYLISLRNKQNYVPQYVGITKAQDFRREVFRQGNLRMISHELRNHRGSCQLHLIVKPKPHHRGYSININKKALKWLEQSVLFSCLIKNSDMCNKSHTAFLKSVEIGRVTGNFLKGKPPERIRTFLNAIGY